MGTHAIAHSEWRYAMAYQVRKWDSFINNYTMIPRDFDSKDEAIEWAKEYIRENMGGDYDPYYDEMQIWVDTLTLGTCQMVGYLYLDESDEYGDEVFEFEECFC